MAKEHLTEADLLELMGAEGHGESSWNADTGGRGAGTPASGTHFRPGYTEIGYPGMPVSPSGVREVLPGVPPEEAMEIGQDLMRRRSKTGDHVDESGNKRRIVTRERFGL